MNARALKVLLSTNLLPLLLLLALPVAAHAQYTPYPTAHGTLYYQEINGAITIEYYVGSDTTLVIPSSINVSGVDVPVTVVVGGFSLGQALTSVTIPDSVTSIGGGAFGNCTNLASVTIGNSVTSIGDGAFGSCSNLTTVTFGSSVTSIGNGAFAFCTRLTTITLPASLTSLGGIAFRNCTKLASIAIPGGVTSIGDYTFEACSNLTSVTIGNSVTNIGIGAFLFCRGLTGITIPASVTSIGNNAFAYCAGLTAVTIPASVTNIGSEAFYECVKLNSVGIGNGLTSIADYAFSDCTNLASVTIGSSVTSIGGGAFYYCLSLTNLAIPKSVTSIGYGSFQACLSLTSFTIGNSVTNIGDYAFEDCISLTNFAIPASVSSIGADTFAGCSRLSGVTIPYGVTSIGEDAFDGCSSLASVVLPGSVTNIGDYAFFSCLKLHDASISNGVITIGSDAFENCTNLSSVIIPNSVISIGDDAFDYCLSLTNINIPDSVTSLGMDTFDSCISLHNITIGNGVTSIGEETFISCSSLTNITVGHSVTSIGSYAFSYCPMLTAVYFQGNSPTPTNDLTVFEGEPIGTVYYVPNTTGWGALFDGWPTMSNVVSSAVGSVSNIVGEVTVKHPDGSTATLQLGDSVQMGDTIIMPANCKVELQFIDNTKITIGGEHAADLTIDDYVFDPHSNVGSSSVGILRGTFEYTSGLIGPNNPGQEKVNTAYDYTGIRGTQFIVRQDPCSSTQMVYLIQGELAITPLDAPGVTNICDAPVTISVTVSNVTTAPLDQATYDSVSNQVFQATGIVTFGSWVEQYLGCTNDPAAAPTADPDGDGQSNYAEFLAGTDPTSSASAFRILSATTEGNDLRVSWTSGGGRTNVLQATTNLGGSWSNVSPNIVLAGSGDSVTNYLDVGAFTNTPVRFYRVLLVQ